MRQQSHQGVELIACHPLIACLHLTRRREPVKERGSLHGLRGSLAPTPCPAVSRAAQHGGWVLSTLRLTQRCHPVSQTLEVAHSTAAGCSPSVHSLRHSPQWDRFAPSSPNLKPGLSQTQT